ncbi:MAG: hypothetical protein AAB944_01940 [Patescibacteria group bacterium]
MGYGEVCNDIDASHAQHYFNLEDVTKRNKKNSGKKYVWGKQSLTDLKEQTGYSHVWVRKQLDTVTVITQDVPPHPVVIGVDTTFWGRSYGVCIFRIPHEQENIWWTEVEKEIMATYYYGRKILEDIGWTFMAAVVDGRRGLTTVFKDIPVQICQFHQMKQVTKYLTRRPETLAGQELRGVMLQLPRSNEKEFARLLSDWKKEWNDFITDKTYVTGTKYWYYTHKKVRGAYRSLERNLPYLFTYLKYPELNIPNTTNSLDGSFSHLKSKLSVHRGMRKDRRYKMISEILKGKEKR